MRFPFTFLNCHFPMCHLCVLSFQRQSFALSGQMSHPLPVVPSSFYLFYYSSPAHSNTDLSSFSSQKSHLQGHLLIFFCKHLMQTGGVWVWFGCGGAPRVLFTIPIAFYLFIYFYCLSKELFQVYIAKEIYSVLIKCKRE